MKNMMSRNSLMKRGSGVFECAICGKMTRDTGENESDSRMCLGCIQKWENGNHHENCDGCDECKNWKEGVDYI